MAEVSSSMPAYSLIISTNVSALSLLTFALRRFSSYEQEQSQLEQQIAEYEENLRNAKVNNDNADTFVETIKEYANIKELTASILHTLIDKIIVHQAEEIDGERVQKIEIFYKFVGKFDDEQDV